MSTHPRFQDLKTLVNLVLMLSDQYVALDQLNIACVKCFKSIHFARMNNDFKLNVNNPLKELANESTYCINLTR